MKYIWVKIIEGLDESIFVKKPPRNNRSPSAPNFTFSETNGKKQKENYQKFWKDKCVWKGMYIYQQWSKIKISEKPSSLQTSSLMS